MSVEMKDLSVDPLNRLRILYNAGRVKRFHTNSTLAYHSISTHVYGTICLAVELCAIAGESPTDVILALLYHDAAESMTGDTPAPIKRDVPALKNALGAAEDVFDVKVGTGVELTEWEIQVVKMCDVLDGMMTCVYERQLGNRHPDLKRSFDNYTRYTEEHLEAIEGARQFYDFIIKEWDNVS